MKFQSSIKVYRISDTIVELVIENDPVYSDKNKLAINMHNLAVPKVSSGPFVCDSNVNSGSDTYAADLISML